MTALSPSRLARWLDRPIGRGPTLLLVALICTAPAGLMAGALRAFMLRGDDFAYLAESRTWPRVLAHLGTPHNAHVVPLFRLWTFLLAALAGRLANLPIVLGVASYGALVLLMLATGHFVAHEGRALRLGLVAMILVGVSTVVEPATTWYSAGQALWAGVAIVAVLVALQGWRRSGGSWRMVLAILAVVAAPAWWSGGYVAGPVGAVYLWADGWPRCRKAAFLLIGATVVAAIGLLALAGKEGPLAAVEGPSRWQDLAAKLLWGLVHTCQMIPEALILNNLGLDAETTAAQGGLFCVVLMGLWRRSWRTMGRPGPLEITGAALVGLSGLLVLTFRGNRPYSSLRGLGWYHAIPQVGAVLLVMGLPMRFKSQKIAMDQLRFLNVRDAGLLIGLLAVWLILQTPRAERIFHASGADPPQRAVAQRRLLEGLDAAERIARAEGIGSDTIRATFGRITGPGLPEEAESLDAADLLDLPSEGRAMEPRRVRALLDGSLDPRHR
jgi:hypothetical protein